MEGKLGAGGATERKTHGQDARATANGQTQTMRFRRMTAEYQWALSLGVRFWVL